MYDVCIAVRNMRTYEVARREHVMFYGLFAAKMYAEKATSCRDVANIDIIDTETGEVYFTFVDGECTYESECVYD